MGTISGGSVSAQADDNSGGDSIYSQRPGSELNQRRATLYTAADTPSPSASVVRTQPTTPVYTPGGNLEPRATFDLSGEEELRGLIGGASSRGCLWQIAAALDPQKWPRTTALLTEGAAGLTRLDWIARLVMPVLFLMFYIWSYWYKRS